MSTILVVAVRGSAFVLLDAILVTQFHAHRNMVKRLLHLLESLFLFTCVNDKM